MLISHFMVKLEVVSMSKWRNKVLLWCQQYISITKFSNILCICNFFKINTNWFYKCISESSLYGEYFFKYAERRLCGHTWYNMHYTTAKVILVFRVEYIVIKMWIKANVHSNVHINMVWTFIVIITMTKYVTIKCSFNRSWFYKRMIIEHY